MYVNGFDFMVRLLSISFHVPQQIKAIHADTLINKHKGIFFLYTRIWRNLNPDFSRDISIILLNFLSKSTTLIANKNLA
jgi:hypothetical protein